jgi:hypothetical protein
MEYKVDLRGDQRVGLRFDEFPSLAHERLVTTIEELTAALHTAVLAGVPRGKTGHLAAQVKTGIEQTDTRVRGWVSLAGASANDVKKAAALEYGSRGEAFDVRGYTRTLDQVFGAITSPFEQVVAAYHRTGGLEELDFLHGPLDATAEAAIVRMNEAVFGAAKEF